MNHTLTKPKPSMSLNVPSRGCSKVIVNYQSCTCPYYCNAPVKGHVIQSGLGLCLTHLRQKENKK